MTTLRIYVADLAAYNAGHLHGVWLDQHDLADSCVAQEMIEEMIAASPVAGAEEYMIHDYEGPIDLSKYSITDVIKACEWLEEEGEGGLPTLAMADYQHSKIDGDTLAYWREAHRHTGKLAEYCEDWHRDCGTEIPDSLAYYIDWDAMARAWEHEGYCSVEVDSETHWFLAH